MAALVEGQQYALSSQGSYSNNKTLIFVKLTDSALRAIEEYLKARAGSSSQPTIQFHANQGVITLPRPTAATNTRQSYGFNLSNVEADGPQGSFECIQQNRSRSLESLGCMLYKMHIHANEDSYEKTKVKMAEVDQEIKKSRTKVIKPGQYVGRKVKVKKSYNPIPPPQPKPPSSPPHPSTIAKPSPKPLNNILHSGSHNSTSSSGNKHNQHNHASSKFGNPDIMRKSYRDRIIHLIALRPYKKPELLARLMKDGIREKDKKGLSAILSQVAVLRDNTYSLARHVWHEVQDDWPFYSPEEVDLIRRKRPPSITPPCENGNHSPTSTQPSSSPIQKRGGHEYEPQPNKKQRISHYNRQENTPVPFVGSVLGSKPDSSGLFTAKPDFDSISHNIKKDTPINGHIRTNFNGTSVNTDCYSQKSPLTESNGLHRSFSSLHTSQVEPEKFNHISSLGLPNGQIDSTIWPADSSQNRSISQVSPDSNTHLQIIPSKQEFFEENLLGDRLLDQQYLRMCDRQSVLNRPKVSSTTNGSGSCHSSPNSSPESRRSVDSKGSNDQDLLPTTSSEIPEYQKKYVVISNGEQRARYKADFNAEYKEYRDLHSIVKKVSKKFAMLEDNLRNSERGSEKWHDIRIQIMKEYEENKRNPHYQDARRRFQFLHDKLSHIKRLVMEYDQAQARTQSSRS